MHFQDSRLQQNQREVCIPAGVVNHTCVTPINTRLEPAATLHCHQRLSRKAKDLLDSYSLSKNCGFVVGRRVGRVLLNTLGPTCCQLFRVLGSCDVCRTYLIHMLLILSRNIFLMHLIA